MSDFDDQSSNGSSHDDENEDTRPNRWKGAPSTWQSLTKQERGLAASLDTLRNEDLSVHLFNAHVLKRRAREIEGKYGANDLPGLPEEDQAFRPPKHWTAWPLSPDDVPRPREQIGPSDNFEAYTFKREEDGAPSRELEDVLIGVTLRFAKERFESREEGEEDIFDDKDMWRSDMEDEKDITRSEYAQSAGEDGEEEVVVKEASRAPPSKKSLKPMVSADDEKSRELLRPSVRNTLSTLDQVLMALHHARKTCHRYSHSEAGTTDDESVLGSIISEQPSYSKQPPGRPRKFANLPNRAKAGPSTPNNPEKIDDADLLRTKTKRLGRPIKVYKRLENETQQEYLIRIARIQKKPLPSFAPPPEPKPSKSPSPRRGRERSRSVPKRTTEEQLRVQRQKKLGLRDWSEVLGVAALVGFPEKLIQRATQRCANLFGEGMVIRRMVEGPFTEEGVDTVVRYEPEILPELDEHALEISSSSGDGSDSESSSEEYIKPPLRNIDSATQKLFCPLPECSRKEKGFPNVLALKKHLVNRHEIMKEEVDDWVLPSDEELEGAVHVDGWLRPLKVIAERGPYRKGKDRKGKRKQEEEESGDENGGNESDEEEVGEEVEDSGTGSDSSSS